MNWILIMVVTALYSQGGTRSVDVSIDKFRTKAECISVAHEAYSLVKEHERSDSAMEYKCIKISALEGR